MGIWAKGASSRGPQQGVCTGMTIYRTKSPPTLTLGALGWGGGGGGGKGGG